MVQNKKLFRQAATEIAKAKGISFKKAKRLLFAGVLSEYYKHEQEKPPVQLQGFWQTIFKENAI